MKFIVASRESAKRSENGIEIWPWQAVLELLYPKSAHFFEPIR